MNNKVQNIVLGVLAVALIGITVAYATLTQQLKINGTATVKAGTWDVHFENLQGSVTGSAVLDTSSSKLGIQTGSTTISGKLGTLSNPGDSITYTFDIVNKGNIPAILSSAPTISTPSCSATGNDAGATTVCGNLTYTLTYSDGSTIAKNDTLAATSGKKSAKLVVTYKSTATSVVNTDVEVSNIAATLNYSQN